MRVKRSIIAIICLIVTIAIFGGYVLGARKPVELQFVNSSIVQAPDKDAINELIAQFEKENPNIKIVHIGNNPPWTKLVTLVLGGQPPDITQLMPRDIPGAHELGILEDLTPYIKREKPEFKNSIIPRLVEGGIFDGKQLALPFFAMSSAVVYNIEHFKNAGLTPPKTTSEFIQVCQKLTDGKTRWGLGIVAAKAPEASSTYVRLFPVFRSFGANFLEQKNGKWVAGFNNERGIEAIQFLTDLVVKYKVVPPGVTDMTYNDVRVAFANGRVSMFLTPNNAVGQVLSDNPKMEGKVGAFLFPKSGSGDYSSLSTGTYMGILKTSKHKEEAWKFMKFLLRPENQEKFAIITGRLPSTTSSLKKDFIQKHPALKVYAQALSYNEGLPPVPEIDEVGTVIVECIQQTFLGRPVKEAVDEAAKRVNEIMSKAKR